MQKTFNPYPLLVNKITIENFAKKIASQFQFNYKYDLSMFVKSLGGTITTLDFSNDNNTIIIDKNSKFEIFVSPFTSLQRDNFTIGYGLGYFFLHYPVIKNNMNNDDIFKVSRVIQPYNNIQQISAMEANWFSSALLNLYKN